MGLDHGISRKGGDRLVDWRKNYVIRQWMQKNLPDFKDNGLTPLSRENLDKAIRAMRDWLDGRTSDVSTPECWYKNKGINAHAGDREELDRQALEALHDMEYVRDYEPGELCYWEWY